MYLSYFNEAYPFSSSPTARPFDLKIGTPEGDPLEKNVQALRRALHHLGVSYIGGDPRFLCLDLDACPPTFFDGNAPVVDALAQLRTTPAAESYRLSLHGATPGCALTYLLDQTDLLSRKKNSASFDMEAITAAFKKVWNADDFIDPRLSAGEMMFRDTAQDPAQSIILDAVPEENPLLQASLGYLRQPTVANRLSWMFLYSRLAQHIVAAEGDLVGLTNTAAYGLSHGKQAQAIEILAKASASPLRQVAFTLCDQWPQVSPLVDLFMNRDMRVRHAKALLASLPTMAKDYMRIRNGSWVASVSKTVDEKIEAHKVGAQVPADKPAVLVPAT